MRDESEVKRVLRVRGDLIVLLTKSTRDRRLAEFCVNSLTVHNTKLLAEAAVVFASEHLEAMLFTGAVAEGTETPES